MGLIGRLYRGDTTLDVVGTRRRWYLTSVVILALCVGGIVLRGFHLGIEFAGGNQFQTPAVASVPLEQARQAVADLGIEVAGAQQVGSGERASYVIRTGDLSLAERDEARAALADRLGVATSEVTITTVSSSWSEGATRRALIALGILLVAVVAYLWIRFDQRMAIAALAAALHTLVVTAGVYALIGFEVTSAVVVGLLGVLGYVLYDTAVMFDRVRENTTGLFEQTSQTYQEAVGETVNQILPRSVTTALMGLLPAASLVAVGGVLGVGAVANLALVLVVGIAAAAYSSLCFAIPVLVDAASLDSRVRSHTRRVLAKRSGTDAVSKAARRQAKRAAEAAAVKPRSAPSEEMTGSSDDARQTASDDAEEASDATDESTALSDDAAEDAVEEGPEKTATASRPASDGVASGDEESDEDDDRELAPAGSRENARRRSRSTQQARKRSGGKGGSRSGRGGGRRRR